MARPNPPTTDGSGTLSGGAARRLIWIPIVHSHADLGSLGEAVRDAHARKFGAATWEDRVRMVDGFWQRVRAEVERLGLDWSRVRLYQDSLPNCGHEAAIVRDLAQAGSENHQLLADLMARGARVVGTECPELLLEEYELMRGILGALKSRESHHLTASEKERSRAILEKRDAYITERIAQTLGDGETGLLFLGMLHSIAGRLPDSIHVIRLFDGDTT
ncbi:MAG TPA: hypothetical protein VNE39_28580 [Planctomycetota bacterium]|nr:hypothetical protein [Planctomycetota bacterium]